MMKMLKALSAWVKTCSEEVTMTLLRRTILDMLDVLPQYPNNGNKAYTPSQYCTCKCLNTGTIAPAAFEASAAVTFSSSSCKIFAIISSLATMFAP
jgi:hypothetical protein